MQILTDFTEKRQIFVATASSRINAVFAAWLVTANAVMKGFQKPLVHCEKSSWNHSLPWKYFYVLKGNFHSMEGAQKFHSMQVVISISFVTIIF
jgi:hypothetical protein